MVEETEKRCVVEILDNHTQEQFNDQHVWWARECNCMMLVFATTSRESFLRLPELRKYVLQRNELAASFPMILVGTKADLVDERQVLSEEAKSWAGKHAMPFVETSCLLGTNVVEAFAALFRITPVLEGPGGFFFFRLTMIGDTGVGKSALNKCFMHNEFVQGNFPCVNARETREIFVCGLRSIKVEEKEKKSILSLIRRMWKR